MQISSDEPASYQFGTPEACLKKIISGGQTGVDRAALDAAIARGFPVGGWCPKGRLAEDGVVPDIYPLIELSGGGYSQRTRKNVQDSDATLIIYYDHIQGGTKSTLFFCLKEKKPFLLIDAQTVSITAAVEKVINFINGDSQIILNVAGPRGSSGSWSYTYTFELIDKVLDRMLNG